MGLLSTISAVVCAQGVTTTVAETDFVFDGDGKRATAAGTATDRCGLPMRDGRWTGTWMPEAREGAVTVRELVSEIGVSGRTGSEIQR